MSPSRAAVAAGRIRPPVMASSAAGTPISRGSRWVPPAPGTMPSVTSGKPMRVPGAASRTWHPSATSQPPPSATPWIAATIGFSSASISSIRSGRFGVPGGGVWSNSLMSAPPLNILPSPVMTSARTPSSAAAARSAACNPERTAMPRPFTGGFLSVMTATPSRFETVTASDT